VLASARGQVEWLDLVAPRPTPLTQLVLPVHPADVDAVSGVSFAVASAVSAFGPGRGGELLPERINAAQLESLTTSAEDYTIGVTHNDGFASLLENRPSEAFGCDDGMVPLLPRQIRDDDAQRHWVDPAHTHAAAGEIHRHSPTGRRQ
jgi:hypothetical protein